MYETSKESVILNFWQERINRGVSGERSMINSFTWLIHCIAYDAVTYCLAGSQNIGTFFILRKMLCHAVFCCNCCAYQLWQVPPCIWELFLCLSFLQLWWCRYSYLPGTAYSIEPSEQEYFYILCTNIFHSKVNTCAEEETLTKYQVGSFHFIPNSTTQSLPGLFPCSHSEEGTGYTTWIHLTYWAILYV